MGIVTDKPRVSARLDFLDNLKAIAIFMVVGIHAAAYINQLTDGQRLFISYVFHSIAVPVFFMVDGFLFAKGQDGKSSFFYSDYIKKSVRRLVVPWIIFTLAYTLCRYVLEQLHFFEENYIVGHAFTDIIISAYGAVYSAQLYFLLALFFIRLTTPIINYLLERINGFVWILVYLLCVSAYKVSGNYIHQILYIEGGQEPLTHALWGLQFYVLGIVIYKFFTGIKFSLLVTIAGLMVFIGFVGNYLPLSIYEPERVLYMIGLFAVCYLYGQFFRFICPFGRQSMGIYLLHVPLVLKIVSIILQYTELTPIIQFFVLTVSGFVISYLLTLLINRIGLGGILFGSK